MFKDFIGFSVQGLNSLKGAYVGGYRGFSV